MMGHLTIGLRRMNDTGWSANKFNIVNKGINEVGSMIES